MRMQKFGTSPQARAPFGVGAESMAWLPKTALRDPLGRVPFALWNGAVAACSVWCDAPLEARQRRFYATLLGSREVVQYTDGVVMI